MKNNLVNMFVGSDIEATYVAALLIDNQIRCFVQTTLEESSSAGWAAGSTYNSSIVRVEIEDAEKAKKIINDYIRDKISSN